MTLQEIFDILPGITEDKINTFVGKEVKWWSETAQAFKVGIVDKIEPATSIYAKGEFKVAGRMPDGKIFAKYLKNCELVDLPAGIDNNIKGKLNVKFSFNGESKDETVLV